MDGATQANTVMLARDVQRARSVDRTLRWLPYVALAASTVMALLTRDFGLPVASIPVTLAVAAGAAVWVAVLGTWAPPWGRTAAGGATFFTGLLILFAALVWCSPLYGFFVWTGYLWTLKSLRGRWQIAGAGSVAFFSAVSQIGGYPTVVDEDGWLIFLVVLGINIGIATAMTYWTSIADAQNERRRQMLDELAEANAKLAAALQENAGLHAQLLAQAREAGVLDERGRMAGEIHDILAQGLTGIVTQLEAADQAADRPGDWRRHLGQAQQLARDSLTEARRSVQALSPQPLTEAALPEVLAEVVDGWSTRTGVSAELITTGTAHRLLPEIETTLLRTAQEALANVDRHAGASRVALTLSYMEDLVSLDVRDDGAGFDPDASRRPGENGGFGLPSMRDRLSRIAGSLAVESEPGGGTALSATVPAMTMPGGRA